jgi:uncharacterized protein YkwD
MPPMNWEIPLRSLKLICLVALSGLACTGPIAVAAAAPPSSSSDATAATASTKRHAKKHRHRHHRHKVVRKTVRRSSGSTVAPNAGAFPPARPPADANAPCPDADLIPDAGNVDRVAAATLCLVNVERARQGVGALVRSAALATAAERYAAQMIAQDFYAHVSPGGSTLDKRILAAGYVSPSGNYTFGENLAVADGQLASPARVVAGWMASAGHRENLLNAAFRETGIAVAAAMPHTVGGGTAAGATYAQELGARGRDLVLSPVSPRRRR